MRRLFQFLYTYRAFLLFVFLEIISGMLIVRQRSYQRAALISTTNSLVGNVLNVSSNVNEYFSLKRVNEDLARENARLKEKIRNLTIDEADSKDQIDLNGNLYHYTYGEVINNTVSNFHNFITINKGSEDSIFKGMGVINERGVVGKVNQVSENFSTVISLLNTDYLVSAKLKRNGPLCTIKWDGTNPGVTKAQYIPRHLKPVVGDTIFTSGFNATFPSDIPIGRIKEINITPEATFYDIEVDLLADFNSLAFVYVIQYELKQEKDSLEQLNVYE